MTTNKTNAQPNYNKLVAKVKECLVDLNKALEDANAVDLCVEIWFPSDMATINTGDGYNISVTGSIIFDDEN